jgi:hypothetical protein
MKLNTKLIGKYESLTPTAVKNRISSLLKQLANDSFSVQALKEIYKVVDVSVAMTFDDEKQLKIATGALSSYNEYDLRISTLARSVSWFLIRSISRSKANIDSLVGLTSEELEVMFKILYPALVELDVISPNEKFMSSRFIEMNLFTAHANGDGYANYNEIHDVVLHLLSGTKRTNYLLPSLLQACHPAVVYTYNRLTSVDLKCTIDFLYKYKNGFNSLPDYLNFKNQGADQVKNMYYNILLAAGLKPEAKEGLTVDTLQNFPHAVQYIEMLFQKYDKGSEIANELNAHVVPSVFIIDSLGTIVYAGALDNKDISVVKTKNSEYNKLTDQAIDQYLKGEVISVPYKKPVGCVFR